MKFSWSASKVPAVATFSASYADGTTRTLEFDRESQFEAGEFVVQGVGRNSSGGRVAGNGRTVISLWDFTTVSLLSPTQLSVVTDDGTTRVVEIDTSFASTNVVALTHATARNSGGAMAGTATKILPLAGLVALTFLLDGQVVA